MKACRREPVPFTPIWLMRQAGRYMKEYRDVRSRMSMLELCKTPDAVSEVTCFARRRIGADAAILFADLLLVVEPLGLTLTFEAGEGPVIDPPVRDGAAVDRLREVDPEELAYVYAAVRATRRDLEPDIPLLGFAGAPFTVASYLVEGRGTRHFAHTKRLMYGDEGAWNGPSRTTNANSTDDRTAPTPAATTMLRHCATSRPSRKRFGAADPMVRAPTRIPIAVPRLSRHPPAAILIPGG